MLDEVIANVHVFYHLVIVCIFSGVRLAVDISGRSYVESDPRIDLKSRNGPYLTI